MNTSTTISDLRKSQIVEACLKKIAEAGSHGITLDDIAEKAGFSKGGIAYYFSSKDALIKEAFREFFDRIFARSRYTMDQYIEPLDKLLSFDWLYNWKDLDVHIGYSMLFECAAMSVHEKEFKRLFHEWVNNWISLLGEALAEGVRKKAFCIRDIDGTARAISAVYHGIATRWYLDPGSHSTDWAVSYARKAITGLLRDAG